MGRIQVEKVKQHVHLTDVKPTKEIPKVGHLGDKVVKRTTDSGRHYTGLSNYFLRGNLFDNNGYIPIAGGRLLNSTDWPHDTVIRSAPYAQRTNLGDFCQVQCRHGEVTTSGTVINDYVLSEVGGSSNFPVLAGDCSASAGGSSTSMPEAAFRQLCSDFSAMFSTSTPAPTSTTTQLTTELTTVTPTEQPTQETGLNSSVLLLTPSSTYLQSSHIDNSEDSSAEFTNSSTPSPSMEDPEMSSSAHHYAPSSTMAQSLAYISKELPSSTYHEIVSTTARHLQVSSTSSGTTTTLVSKPCQTGIPTMRPITASTNPITWSPSGTTGTTGPTEATTAGAIGITASTPDLPGIMTTAAQVLKFGVGIGVGIGISAVVVLTATGIAGAITAVKSYLARRQEANEQLQIQVEPTPVTSDSHEYTITPV